MRFGRGPPALPHLRTLSYSHAWTSFNFESWEGQSVSEVFAGVQEAGPQVGVVRGQHPLPKKILHLVGIRYAISLPIFVKKLIRPKYSHQIIKKKTWLGTETCF